MVHGQQAQTTKKSLRASREKGLGNNVREASWSARHTVMLALCRTLWIRSTHASREILLCSPLQSGERRRSAHRRADAKLLAEPRPHERAGRCEREVSR